LTAWLVVEIYRPLVLGTKDFVAAGAAGVRVKTGAQNILQNGDFDWDGCVSGDVDPTGWSGINTETIDYVADPLTTGLQGEGCQVEVTAVANGDGLTQTLAGLKANTTYRVVAQVLEGAADECSLTTTGAATEITTEMVSTDNTAFAQLEGFFVTAAAAIDSVAINLVNSAAGDICNWDHIGVYRQEAAEVPEAGVVAVYDTYTGTDGVPAAAGTDVTDLSITFVPPTEGWMIQVGGTISTGCASNCSVENDEGVTCELQKGGSGITGTVHSVYYETGDLQDIAHAITMNAIDINPTAGTSITYTAECFQVGSHSATFNYNSDESNLWMMAYPPH
jgi:hypothetical protein